MVICVVYYFNSIHKKEILGLEAYANKGDATKKIKSN